MRHLARPMSPADDEPGRIVVLQVVDEGSKKNSLPRPAWANHADATLDHFEMKRTHAATETRNTAILPFAVKATEFDVNGTLARRLRFRKMMERGLEMNDRLAEIEKKVRAAAPVVRRRRLPRSTRRPVHARRTGQPRPRAEERQRRLLQRQHAPEPDQRLRLPLHVLRLPRRPEGARRPT